MTQVLVVPQRTVQQRLEALERANLVRLHNADLKRRVAAREIPVDAVFDDELGQRMRVIDLLMALPRVGRVKSEKILRRAGISPVKTVGGMTARQRGELMVLLSGVGLTSGVRCDS